MLIRFVAKNIFSFKEETEFNVFPNKTQRLPHHKVTKNEFDILRLSAIYGANGSGKSNLIQAALLLKTMIENGTLMNNVEYAKFKLCEENQKQPISFGIEFCSKSKVYYYSLTFDDAIILNESLYESKKNEDILIFERNNENNSQTISFFEEYAKNPKNQLFVEVLAEKLLQKNELLLSFLHSKYKQEFEDVNNAFKWFSDTLVIVEPDKRPTNTIHILDTAPELKEFANHLIMTLNTGITQLNIEKKIIENTKIIERLSEHSVDSILIIENDKVVEKKLVSTHLNDKGEDVEFSLGMESDGTRRLIDYIPMLFSILNQEVVCLVDEIERSIHPILIKEILSKISLDQSAKGQLIFTTHESCLLDQAILRADEIWLAQKDSEGASKIYSLSDFNIHKTANIENGYLNGRYGGIPFLSNLHDLNWHTDELSK